MIPQHDRRQLLKSTSSAAPRPSDASPRTADVADAFREFAGLDPVDPERKRLRDELVGVYLPVARNIASRYRNRGVPIEDLQQVATIGLINAVDRFDPDRGFDFLAYAIPTVTGEVRRHFRDRGWAVQVPRRLRDLHHKLGAAIDELSQRLGRAPTTTEMAEYTKLTRDQVVEGLEARRQYSSDTLDRDDAEISQSILDATRAMEPGFELIENRHSLRPQIEALPDRERAILGMRFFENMTQTQIAHRLGISQMHVSRLLSKTLDSLRAELSSSEP